jgi:hypothetical protein
MKSVQPSLFAEYEDELLTEQQIFCVKHKHDSSLDIDFVATQDEEPEQIALEKLGYFVVAKT